VKNRRTSWATSSGISVWPLVPDIPSGPDQINEAIELADLINQTQVRQTSIALSKNEIPQPQFKNIRLKLPRGKS
jgi:sulfur carrier protein ThiS